MDRPELSTVLEIEPCHRQNTWKVLALLEAMQGGTRCMLCIIHHTSNVDMRPSALHISTHAANHNSITSGHVYVR